MRNVLETVGKVLDRDVSILILGESGTGKDYLAEAIHACSIRRAEPFVHIECASIPPDLFESELFGHERGTFTDAQARKPGRLELARRGTVYLDDVAALTPPLQAKLLRAIQERRFTRLGGNASVPFEARVISSSSADVAASLAEGTLRPDFYYRINVVTIALPPLRERREDIVALARQFARRAGPARLTPEAEQLLIAYSWPGNVRELRNAVERAAMLRTGDALPAEAFVPGDEQALVATGVRAGWTLEQLEAHYIREVLRTTGTNFSRAAEVLGINRKTLLEKRKKYGIE